MGKSGSGKDTGIGKKMFKTVLDDRFRLACHEKTDFCPREMGFEKQVQSDDERRQRCVSGSYMKK